MFSWSVMICRLKTFWQAQCHKPYPIGGAHFSSCIQVSNMLFKKQHGVHFSAACSCFLVPSTSSGAFKHVYVDDAWNVAPQSKRMFEWLILFSQNPLIDHVFLWYQYINQYLSTCFPHVGTNLVFFPRFQPADIWASHLYTTSWTWQARQENSLPWICCLDMSRQWCLVFQHVSFLWGNPCLAILKK